jgi:hypothetical protein
MPTAPAKPRARATSPAKATGKQTARKTETSAKKAATKTTSTRKTTAKKASTKKASARKTTAKKSSAKQTTAKKAAKKPARTSSVTKPAKHPFPFFGAGAASYFEWGGLYVWFEDPPARAARSKLLKKIPEPFRHDAGWGGPVLHATSGDQFINLHICTAYAKLGDQDDDRGDPDDEDYMDGLEFGVGQPFPNTRQMKAFEADIDAWLLALDRKHKIAFVARREDSEAGGTRLSAWHRWSLTRFADVVLPLWQAHHASPRHRLMNWTLHEVLGLVLDSNIADTVPAAVRTWYAKDR